MRTHRPMALIALMWTLCAPGCKSKDRSANVLATIGGQDVTQAEFDAFLELKRIDASDESQREKALEQFLERESMARAIARSDSPDPTLQAEVDEFRRQVLISRYFERFLEQKVTEEAVRNYYTSHAKDYERRQVHVAHILVRTNRQMSPEERAARLTTAQEAQSKLVTGQEFADVARATSDDAVSGKGGGDLGWISEGSVAPAFSKRAFEMKPGEVSEPVETQFGFHVIKVLEGARAITRPFSDVAGDIRYKLRAEAKDAEMARLRGMAAVKKGAPYVPSVTETRTEAARAAVASAPEPSATKLAPAPEKRAN